MADISSGAVTEDKDPYIPIIRECLKFDGNDVTVNSDDFTYCGREDEKIKVYLEKVQGERVKPCYNNFMEKLNLKMKVYNDPIHGSIQLNMLEDAIVNTPEFYRLREIKQLGGKSHVFPGAVHTRFEHSIGVCHLAGVLIKHLKERSKPDLSKQEELCVRLAGLCHDLGHGPYSHSFDGIKEKIAGKDVLKHEQISVMIFKRILLEHTKILVMFGKCDMKDEHIEMIGKMINCSEAIMDKAERSKCYLYEIVANKKSGMDVDKWDYFARDCHYLGLKNEFDMGRCIALSSIVSQEGRLHIGFRDKEKRNIYGMFRTRCDLYQKAYSHKTADGIEMMIKDALYLARDIPLQLPSTTGDQPTDTSQTPRVTSVNSTTTLKKIIQNSMKNDLSGYIQLTDSILRTLMLIPVNDGHMEDLKKVQNLIGRIAKRDLYKCIEEQQYYSDMHESPSTLETLKNGIPFLEDEDFEIESISIKYASEESEDPVAKNILFFDKDGSEALIPEIQPSSEKTASKLNIPRAFKEYRLRLYSKNFLQLNDKKVKDKKREFLEYLWEEMCKVEKKRS